MGLEIIFKAVRKGATSIVVNDLQYWKKIILSSDHPDLSCILHDSKISKEQLISESILPNINPWDSIKKLINKLSIQGCNQTNALLNALQAFSVSYGNHGLTNLENDDADLIFIQIANPIKRHEKITEVLFPMLFLENEDSYIKAVMKRGELVFSKFGPSLENGIMFEEPFYPQISKCIDASFDKIETAIHDLRKFRISNDLGQGKFVIVVDNEDRENEGDVILAAQDMTPEKASFMIRYTRY